MRRKGSRIIYLRLIGLMIIGQLFVCSEAFSQRDSLFNKYAAGSVRSSSDYLIVKGEIPATMHSLVVRQLSTDVQVIHHPGEMITQISKPGTLISEASPFWKCSPGLEKNWDRRVQENKTRLYTIVVTDIQQILASLQELDIVSKRIDSINRLIVVEISNKEQLIGLLHKNELIFIDDVQKAHTEASIIGYDRSFHGINALDYLLPGVTGKNIVVGVKEQNMDQTDLDLYKRVLPSTLAAPTIQAHATIIASIIGGAGNSFYDGRGLAHQSSFFSSSFSNLFADDDGVLRSNKVSVQNHSYGTLPQQFYGAEALTYDVFGWRNKEFVHVFSSGNRGTQSATEGRYAAIPGFANITGNFKMAKNVITIGAIDNAGNIASESSAGPIYDGRMAPQLVALGPNGTSDAAAVVTGTIALMQQSFSDSNNQQMPPASLVKALLYNTADDVYSPGIDFKTGFGLLNSYKAVKAILSRKYFSGTVGANQVWTQNISVPANIGLLKLTLSWTDTASQVNNNKALINDLDLEIREVNTGQVYQPWILNTQANIDSLKKTPIRGRDSLNTAEQISISLPASGIYEIRVIGRTINNGSIPFHLAYSFDTLNRFEFLSPQHSSDVNRAETERIFVKWETAVADTNQTGTLSISYDGGFNWNTVQNLKIYKGQYSWTIKDTQSRAQFRMVTGFGTFYSKEFLISPVVRPRLDFNCADSIQISWPKHIYASSYKIYALGTNPALQVIEQTTDTFKVLSRAGFPYDVYAVEPILNNQIPASRSVAFNINFQGVNCFYRTLNYNQLDKSSLNLVLELGTTRYVDSLYFDIVTANGALIKQVGSLKTIGTNLIYTQLVENLSRGTNFFRARIKLQNGQIISTNIISITVSGEQLILFYPNPASRNTGLQYVLQQGVPGDCRLLFYDITGRLIKDYPSIPAKIDLSSFPSGVVMYRLILPGGKTEERGKVLVR